MQLFLAGTESNGLTFRQWFCLDLVRLVLLFPEQGQIIIFQATAHLNFKTVAWKYTKKVLAFCVESVWGTNCLHYSWASRKRLYLFVHLFVFLYYLLVIYNVIMLYCTYFSLSLFYWHIQPYKITMNCINWKLMWVNSVKSYWAP